MSKIRFVILGLGHIGKRHAKHISENKNADLVATIDIDESKSLSGIPAFKNWESFLKSNIAADVVNVCTPNYLHATHSCQALQSGYHVVCEKPMAISTADANRMVQVAEEAGKNIFVVKQNRYNPPVQEVKKVLDRLGKIFFVNVNCFWNRNHDYYAQADWRGKKEMDGGIVFTQFSHFVDILYYLFGDMDCIHSLSSNQYHPNNTIEDNLTATLENKNRTIINFNASICAYEKNMEGAITIIAEKGTIKIGGQYLNTIEYQQLEGDELPKIKIQEKNNDYGAYQGSMSNHDLVIQNVIDHLQSGVPIMTNAQEGRDVVKIMESIYRKISK